MLQSVIHARYWNCICSSMTQGISEVIVAQPRGRFRRAAAAGVAAVLGFGTLLFVAPHVGQDVDIMGLSDDTVHTIAHLAVYGGLAILVATALGGRLVLSWILTILLAGGEEWHQQFVPGRIVGWDDMLLNVVGISAALMIVGIVLKIRRWRETSSGHVVTS